MTLKWSQYQLDIFDNVANVKSGHVFIEAKAGSSKTTSLLESLKHIPEGKKTLLCAFNTKIADELKTRAPKFNGEIRTLHSLGYKALRDTFGTTFNAEKTTDIIQSIVGKGREKSELRYSLSQAVSLAQNSLSREYKEIDDLIDEYDISFPPEIFPDIFIKLVQKTLGAIEEDTQTADYNSMIYLPNIMKVKIKPWDYILVDEFQDLNFAQTSLILKTIHDDSRLFFYGDSQQNVYQFRCADPRNIINLKNTLNATTLPLSISYRCPIAVIKEAQRLVPSIEAAPNAIEGKVETITLSKLKSSAQMGCFILSRTNAPLIGLALYFISQGKPANIQGRDLGNNLLSLIKKSKCKKIDKFLEWVDKWSKKEIARLQEKDKDIEPVVDKVECFKALSDGCNSVVELTGNIDKLFIDKDDAKKIILSTVHRAKGLEREVVYLLDWTFKYFNQEEKNIRYVSITRSKKELYYVKKD